MKTVNSGKMMLFGAKNSVAFLPYSQMGANLGC